MSSKFDSLMRGMLSALFWFALCWFAMAAFAASAEEIHFNRQIRPILSANCYHCHGPDDEDREADLRLDEPDGIAQAFGESTLDDNEAWQRITSDDEDFRMPPPDAHLELKPEEVALLKKWIEAGAPYEQHWAFISPEEQPAPSMKDVAWVRNAIDAFVFARLEHEGLQPTPDASREALIRRLSLDLTGLPPTLEEVDAFVKDDDPDAYEKVVDRLLSSLHFGERMAVPWLDAARYADTNGFSIDDHRDMWLWREWVIDALNRNMPYDQFVVEQLAGDLLPEATDQTRLATGFLRNSMNTHEGGTLPEEYRVIYIADKIDTVSTVFMGLTLRCAQCHDHKYDPLSQRDYYKFYAFFDTAHEPGRGAVNGNTQPAIRMDGLLTDAQRLKADIEERIATLQRYKIHPPELIQPRAEWEKETQQTATGELAAALDVAAAQRTDEHWQTINAAFAKINPRWTRHAKTIDREIEVLKRDLNAGQSSVMVMKEQGPRQTYVLTRGQYDAPDTEQPVSSGVPAALPPLEHDRPVVETVKPKDRWGSAQWIWNNGRAAVKQQDTAPRYFRFKFELPANLNRAELFVTADDRCTTYLNGQKLGTNEPWMTPAKYDVSKHLEKGQNVIAIEAVNVGGPAGLIASLSMDEKQIVTNKHWQVSIEKKTNWFSREFDDSSWAKATELGPANMSPWKLATPSTGNATASGQATRLDLARWLVSSEHPLTARVAVNRHWQMLFGRGLVSTPNDFGSQGTFPSHPELLDWLATQYVKNGWDTKWLIKTIVMSSTYRQSSSASAEMIKRDPNNILLARAPRFRLPAEFIRDNALAIAGTLNKRVGGPSVYPVQPHGLWREVSHFGYFPAFTSQAFYPSQGNRLHRRSMYTFWKRTSPPPSMTAFDAPTREVCTVQRSRTNTPLQALVLLNDPQYVAAASALASSHLKSELTIDERITRMFRLATSRLPDAEEQSILRGRYDRALAKYRRDDEQSAEHAALTVVASIILNLDEVITRE